MNEPRRIVGCMTGTSLDALDAAIVEVRGRGLTMSAQFIEGASTPLGELGRTLRRIADQEALRASEFARAADALGRLHARAIMALLGGRRAELVCVHGQTVFHAPPISWQLIQPATIARVTGCAVVFDLRAADLAAGGQGAPITPLADWVLFRGHEPRAIVNLGGFCNLTRLPAQADPAGIGGIRGGDACACNHALDAIARRRLDAGYDHDGAHAIAGRADPAISARLAEALDAQRRDSRSLGTGDELSTILSITDNLAPNDAARTVARAVGLVIGAAIRDGPALARAFLAGGGARNRALVFEITDAARVSVEPTDRLGVPIEFREAAGMAVLGALSADGVPIALPAVTGAAGPALAGVWIHPPKGYSSS